MKAYDDFHKVLNEKLTRNAVKYLARFDLTAANEIGQFLMIPFDFIHQMGAERIDQITEASKYNQYTFKDEHIKFDDLKVFTNEYDDILGFSIVGINPDFLAYLNTTHIFWGLAFQCVKRRYEKTFDFYC